MEFEQVLNKRYSCRKFADREVEQEKIDKILQAARIAPTAVNRQPQRVYVIKSKEALEAVKQCTRFSFDAPLNFLLCYDKNASWKRGCDKLDSGFIDASIAGTYMMLAAQDLGLGSTWVGSFDPIKTAEAFELPENIIPAAFFPMGYPAEDAVPADMHFKRSNTEDFVTVL